MRIILVVFCFLALSIGSALSESPTYDEVFYRGEGRRIWQTRTFSDPYNPPLLPIITHIAFGRAVPIFLGAVLLLAVYRSAGLPAALLLAFEPTFLAHSHYITSDGAVTLFVFLFAMARTPVLLGLAAGFALASKMTALFYLPVILVVRRKFFVISAVIAIIVVWASYFFSWDVIIRARQDPTRLSERLKNYSVIKFLREQPLPLGTYLATIKNNVLRVGQPAMIFFDGQIYDRSRWYFLIVNVFRKLSIPFLLLAAIGARHRQRFVLIATAIIGSASFVGLAPLVRFVLPAIPFLAVVAAAGIRKNLLALLVLWHVVSTVLQYPHFISYTNELVPTEKRYELLADSNLDWGQALPDAVGYAKRKGFGTLRFSYFGRLDERIWRFEDICAFRQFSIDPNKTVTVTMISVSNWYSCGYNKEDRYRKERIWDVVADSLLVF